MFGIKSNLVKYQGVDKNGNNYTRWVSPEEFKSLHTSHGQAHKENAKQPSDGQDLEKYASNTPKKNLEKTINESKDSKLKEVAKKELDKRGIKKNGFKTTKTASGKQVFEHSGFFSRLSYKMEKKSFAKENPKLAKLLDNDIATEEFYDKIVSFQDADFKDGNKNYKAINQLLTLRLKDQLGINIEGSFYGSTGLAVGHHLETIKDSFPPGHFLDNPCFTGFNSRITKWSSPKGGNMYYALYSREQGTISMSDQRLDSFDITGTDIHKIENFKMVFNHELGHSIDESLNYTLGEKERLKVLNKFSKILGFDKYEVVSQWKTVPRKDNGVKIITRYAATSPSEAFAEYYSFYSINKASIDKFLDGGEVPSDLSFKEYSEDGGSFLKKISEDEIKSSKKVFEWMKTTLWDNPKIAKSLLDLGMIHEDKYLEILIKSHVNGN